MLHVFNLRLIKCFPRNVIALLIYDNLPARGYCWLVSSLVFWPKYTLFFSVEKPFKNDTTSLISFFQKKVQRKKQM